MGGKVSHASNFQKQWAWEGQKWEVGHGGRGGKKARNRLAFIGLRTRMIE